MVPATTHGLSPIFSIFGFDYLFSYCVSLSFAIYFDMAGKGKGAFHGPGKRPMTAGPPPQTAPKQQAGTGVALPVGGTGRRVKQHARRQGPPPGTAARAAQARHETIHRPPVLNRRKPRRGTAALREIRAMQRSTEPILRLAPFARYVRKLILPM